MCLIAFPRPPGRIAVYFESFCVRLRIDNAGVDTHARVVRPCASWCVHLGIFLRACAIWAILLRAFASRGKSRSRIRTKKTRIRPGVFSGSFPGVMLILLYNHQTNSSHEYLLFDNALVLLVQ